MKDLPTQIGWFATKGSGTNEAQRIATLLSHLPGLWELPFDKHHKRQSFFTLLRLLRRRQPALLVMEGTGVAGGLACLIARALWKVPFVVSSGDAVGPFIAVHHPAAGVLAACYEWLLYRYSAGFIGWTPYLVGRALTMGAPKGVTAPGWVLGGDQQLDMLEQRRRVRDQWKIPQDAIVVGLLGAIEWNEKWQYCYGLELVECAQRMQRKDVVFVVVGSGSGLEQLRTRAGVLLGSRVILPGAVALQEVMSTLSAFDIASLPQSMDGVGMFRYTTKLSEYAAAGLPIITSQIPAAYDLMLDWSWRLPGAGPWTTDYISALTSLLEQLDSKEIAACRAAVSRQIDTFQKDDQMQRVTAFIKEILLPVCPI